MHTHVVCQKRWLSTLPAAHGADARFLTRMSRFRVVVEVCELAEACAALQTLVRPFAGVNAYVAFQNAL